MTLLTRALGVLLLCIVIQCIVCQPAARAQNAPVSKIQVSEPSLNEEHKLTLDLYYQSSVSGEATVQLAGYKFNAEGDSLLVYQKSSVVNLKKGVNTKALVLSASDSATYWLPVFYSIIRKTGAIPPGNYKVFIKVSADGAALFQNTQLQLIDSNLKANSSLRKDLNNTLLPENKATLLGIDFSAESKAANTVFTNSSKAVDRAGWKIERLFKSKGLTTSIQKGQDKDYINLYYEDWFVGRYELDTRQSLQRQINKQKDQLTGNVTSLVSNELESYQSLFSQLKELQREKKENAELVGQLALSGNWSTGQQEYSGQDNNYYELRGNVETEVFDIPVGIEGYYTTQDQHRQVKASYMRVHYDVEKAKAELLKLIGGYNKKFSQTAAKGKGLELVYGSYLNSLEGQKGKLLGQLSKETGIADFSTGQLNVDEAALKQKIVSSLEQKMKDTAAALLKDGESSLDSSAKVKATAAKAQKIADSAEVLYQKAMKRYEQVQALEKQLRKYYTLLEQYKTTTYFDSSLAYDKIKDLKDADEMTYKQLAKKAGELLPEGKAKTFVAGLTHLDAGIFPKYTSRYTMAGQQLKGLDVGYDLGFCRVAGTVGKTEYAGRDGSLDKYTTYSAQALFTPFKGSELGLVYYGYTPSKSMVKSDNEFYKDYDLALPSFREPVHVISAVYTGTIAKSIQVEGEAATSFRKGKDETFRDGLDYQRIAWHLNAEGDIPKTTLSFTAGYEHGGKDFQNSTLPVMPQGTDRYQAGIKGDLFRSFLTLGVTYNYMEQRSFVSKGSNTRWGFEVSTHSKQYPSVNFSYKPFSAFRSYSDTMGIPQRPLLGEVWTGRASYQIKQKGRVWRFMATYNKNTSEQDTSSYGSGLLMLSAIYTTKEWMGMLSAGNTRLSNGTTEVASPAHQDTRFVMASGSRTLNSQTSLSGGGDIGFAAFGLSKWGLNAGVQHRLKKIPMSLRAVGRYTTYRLASVEPWKQFCSGSLDLIWQFKMKVFE